MLAFDHLKVRPFENPTSEVMRLRGLPINMNIVNYAVIALYL